ncbi:MAG: hypothetical protein JSR87_03375 [Proteobacteria bacterium]|nr:hypothetical protein [Pseudomonadota bacterium]MBS0574569.1 hypothetical protein [Pseudomonadota bacterium]
MSGGAVTTLEFAPLLPWPLVAALAGLALAVAALALWRGLAGWPLRLLAAACLTLALAGPVLRSQTRVPLKDVVVLLTDTSASNRIGGREDQTRAAAAALARRIASLPGIELRQATVADAPGDGGTLAVAALARTLAEVPENRLAGAILVSDGQAADADLKPSLPAPLTLLLTGSRADWDRRLHITRAPAFAIIGQETKIGLRIDELGRLPAAEKGRPVAVSMSVDGAPPATVEVAPGQDIELPLTLTHAGANVVQISIPEAAGELTGRNNAAVMQVSGVRDRLKVLLVSGEPYAGERTWRNLLKSDAAVDLVHFTILRPPDKEDGVPVGELSLIAFPTRELFVEKIDQFDLIIFDRYAQRGILQPEYLDNIRAYIEGGGAVLVAAGPEFASAESLYYSGLGQVLPAQPTSRVIEGGFTPRLTDLGHRHPVTEGLEAGAGGEGGKPWGRWLRYVELSEPRGQVVMEGPEGRPLLILNRVGKGRVALLASDQAWLWSRGFEGGGPQQELLRRLAHWMMKEPDLEEEALAATVHDDRVTITRRSLTESAREVTITGPDGAVSRLALNEVAPGRYSADWRAPQPGLYRMQQGELRGVFALGSASPREYDDATPSAAPLAVLTAASNGGALWLEDGLPDVRLVRAGRPAVGRGWLGIVPRGAYRTPDMHQTPLVPDALMLALAAAFMLGAWLVEGRRPRGKIMAEPPDG